MIRNNSNGRRRAGAARFSSLMAGHCGRQAMADGDTTTIGTYAYWPDHRRASKTVEHCGSEALANDGGDTVVYFYYSNKWQILETRNGSSQATRQWVWGTRYVDEVLFMDVNGDPATSNICDADDPNKTAGTRRYFYHQDRNWNVVALSEYGGDGIGTNGRLAERYAYTPYGEFVVLKGDGGSGELGRVQPASGVGNIFFRRGLPFDQERRKYQTRYQQHRGRTQQPGAPSSLRSSEKVGSTPGDGGGGDDDPPPSNACYVRWRRNPITGTGRTAFHMGLDIDTNGDGNPDGNVDYGWSGSTWFSCCSENIRWTEPAHVHAPGKVDPPDPGSGDYTDWYPEDECICNCLNGAGTNMGHYCLFGVPLDPCCSNSNGAMNKVYSECNGGCSDFIPNPPAGWG